VHRPRTAPRLRERPEAPSVDSDSPDSSPDSPSVDSASF
jgi:hypothetical protein